MVTVVNLKTDKYTVYGGRPGKGIPGNYGNPFVIGVDGKKGECIELFRKWFHSDSSSAKQMRERALSELTENDIIACFCKPGPCHLDIIAEFVNKEKGWI